MQLSLQVELEHGVMFLSDPYKLDIVPADTGINSVTYTKDCVAFWVPSYLDGGAKVFLGEIETDNITYEYEISIKCASKVLSLSDSNRFNFLFIKLVTDIASIKMTSLESSNGGPIYIDVKNISKF